MRASTFRAKAAAVEQGALGIWAHILATKTALATHKKRFATYSKGVWQ